MEFLLQECRTSCDLSPLMAHFARPPSGGGSTRQSAAGSRPPGFLYGAAKKGDHGVVRLPVFKC